MSRVLAVLLVGVTLALVLPPPASAQVAPPKARRLERLEQWLAALARHEPGERDEVILEFASWTGPHWEMLVTDVQVFSRLTIHPELPIRALSVIESGRRRPIPNSYSSAEQRQMYVLACAFAWSPVANCATGQGAFTGSLRTVVERSFAAHQKGDDYYVLRLAALLHTDLAIRGITQDTAPSVVSGTMTRMWVDVDDGRGANMRRGGVQWQLAYSVVDPILDEDLRLGRRPRDRWSRDWYAATSAWMQGNTVFDQAHVDHAFNYFPDDPELRFWSATLHEIDGGPTVQHAMRSFRMPTNMKSFVEAARDEWRAARSDLTKALNARPDWPEARLRLGRVHAQLGDWDAAAEQLRSARGTLGEPHLEYHASLFLGFVEEQLAHFDSAATLYQDAAARFPDAQSPYLALSQLARRRGDRRETQRQLQRAFAVDANGEPDPWWRYLEVQSRDADQRLADLARPLWSILR